MSPLSLSSVTVSTILHLCLCHNYCPTSLPRLFCRCLHHPESLLLPLSLPAPPLRPELPVLLYAATIDLGCSVMVGQYFVLRSEGLPCCYGWATACHHLGMTMLRFGRPRHLEPCALWLRDAASILLGGAIFWFIQAPRGLYLEQHTEKSYVFYRHFCPCQKPCIYSASLLSILPSVPTITIISMSPQHLCFPSPPLVVLNLHRVSTCRHFLYYPFISSARRPRHPVILPTTARVLLFWGEITPGHYDEYQLGLTRRNLRDLFTLKPERNLQI